MITVSPLAAEKLSTYLSENNINLPVRIRVLNGCGGPSLSLALDEQKDGDIIHSTKAFTLLAAGDLIEECGPIAVDYVETESGCGSGGGGGFALNSQKPLPGSGSGCGGSCKSGCGC